MPSNIETVITRVCEAWPRLVAAAKRVAPSWRRIMELPAWSDPERDRETRYAVWFIAAFCALLGVAAAVSLALS